MGTAPSWHGRPHPTLCSPGGRAAGRRVRRAGDCGLDITAERRVRAWPSWRRRGGGDADVVPIGAPEGYGLARGSWCSTCPRRRATTRWPGRRSTTAGDSWPSIPHGFGARMRCTWNASARPLPRRTALVRTRAAGRPSRAGSSITCPVVGGVPGHRLRRSPTRGRRAVLGLTAALTVLACAATVVPLYVLARASLAPRRGRRPSWAALPPAVLFQPLPDTAYPLPAVTVLRRPARGGSAGTGFAPAAGTGIVPRWGCSSRWRLAVGLVVAIVLVTGVTGWARARPPPTPPS